MSLAMKTLLILFALSTAASAQWQKVATEGTSTSPGTIVLPIGSTYRLGCATGNSAPITVTKPTTLSMFFPAGSFPFSDPCPGVAKELDLQLTASPQVLTVNGNTLTVAAKPLPPMLYTVTMTATMAVDPVTFKATFSNIR